jgi:hypothetical protein
MAATCVVETAHNIEKRRLSASRGSEQDDNFRARYFEIHAAQRADFNFPAGINLC